MIKKEYLQGCTPKELAEKYGIKAKAVSDKATKEGWTAEKSQICVNIRKSTEEQIENITNLALRRLEDVLTSESVKDSDLINAIGKAFDISGLKTSKQELTGKDGSALIQKVYVSAKEIQNADEHIDGVINEQ